MKSIDDLLLNKDFKELSEEEKRVVLREFTETQYDSYRKLVLESKEQIKEENDKLIPKTEILESLKVQMKQKESSLSMRILKYPIPAYQIFLIAAMLILVLWLFKFQDKENGSKRIQYVYKTDTIYLTSQSDEIKDYKTEPNIVKQMDSELIERENVPGQKISYSKTIKQKNTDNFGFGLQVNLDEFLKNQNCGESLSTNQDLKQFIVAVN